MYAGGFHATESEVQFLRVEEEFPFFMFSKCPELYDEFLVRRSRMIPSLIAPLSMCSFHPSCAMIMKRASRISNFPPYSADRGSACKGARKRTAAAAGLHIPAAVVIPGLVAGFCAGGVTGVAAMHPVLPVSLTPRKVPQPEGVWLRASLGSFFSKISVQCSPGGWRWTAGG